MNVKVHGGIILKMFEYRHQLLNKKLLKMKTIKITGGSKTPQDDRLEEFNLGEMFVKWDEVFNRPERPKEWVHINNVKKFIKIVDNDFLEDWENANGKTFTLAEVRAIINFRAGDKFK